MNRNKRKKLDGEKIFSIVATLAIVAALAVGIITIVKSATAQRNKNFIDLNVVEESKTSKEDENNLVADNKDNKPTEEITKPTEGELPTETVTEDIPDVEASVTEEAPSIEVNAPVYTFNETSSLLWPVEGEIVLGYNMENTIYFPTLKQYQCNPAIVISVAKGTDVVSAAPGVVEDIYEDPVIGTTMVVSVGNGYKLIYGQLSELAVGISDDVEAGTIIGKVGTPTKYFTVEGSNLYFQLTADNKPVDPTLYLIGNE